MSVIRQLSAQLSNQIAAGEVVERPASIVKECVENCLDAGALQVSIRIDQAGTQKIIIQDDGVGIAQDDLVLALARHATSKIAVVEDLFALRTFGFRGEALASIASISRCRVISRPATQAEAWQVRWDPQSQECQVTKASHPIGTTVEIQDLFYNVPVRRKFLKSLKTEWVHIEDVVKRFALSHFEVGFDLFHNELPRWQLPAALNESQRLARISKCMGSAFAEKAWWIEAEASGLRLTGWVAPPECARRQSNEQHFFVNRRSVRDRMIAYAVKDVLGHHLENGYYPCFILYLEMDPEAVDINVHPTKQEVRFREARHVQEFIRSALGAELMRTPMVNSEPALVLPLPRVFSTSDVSRVERNNISQSPIRDLWKVILLNADYAMVSWDHHCYLVDCQACLDVLFVQNNAVILLLLPETVLFPPERDPVVVQAFLESLGFHLQMKEGMLRLKQIPKILKETPLPAIIHHIQAVLNLATPNRAAFFAGLDLSFLFQAAEEWQAVWPMLRSLNHVVPFDDMDWRRYFKH